MLSFYLVDSPADRLWVFDSFHMHLPGALNVVNVLDGKESFRILQNSLDRPYATHIFVGFFFWLFGVTPVVSGVALLVPKLGVVFFTFLIGRKLFSSFVGAMAAASYVLLPTITYYTVVFYKESFVQLFIVASFFYLLRLRLERFAVLNLLFFLMSTLLLANERFYLFPLFILAGLWAVLRNRLLRPRRRALLAFGSLVFFGAFLYYFSDQIHFASIMGVLNRYRGEYNAYSDVDRRWNADLPYPMGIIKLYFTPYFTLRKFSMFSEFSLLLIWGSFFNQILMLGSLVGLFLRYRVRGALRSLDEYGYLLLPVVGFLAVFGYVAPFAGRLRDGFVPLLLVFFASALESYFSRQNSYLFPENLTLNCRNLNS